MYFSVTVRWENVNVRGCRWKFFSSATFNNFSPKELGILRCKSLCKTGWLRMITLRFCHGEDLREYLNWLKRKNWGYKKVEQSVNGNESLQIISSDGLHFEHSYSGWEFRTKSGDECICGILIVFTIEERLINFRWNFYLFQTEDVLYIGKAIGNFHN